MVTKIMFRTREIFESKISLIVVVSGFIHRDLSASNTPQIIHYELLNVFVDDIALIFMLHVLFL